MKCPNCEALLGLKTFMSDGETICVRTTFDGVVTCAAVSQIIKSVGESLEASAKCHGWNAEAVIVDIKLSEHEIEVRVGLAERVQKGNTELRGAETSDSTFPLDSRNNSA